jgi:putative membrane protein
MKAQFIWIALCAVTAVGAAFAAGTEVTKQISAADRKFLETAAQGGKAEVMLGEIAAKNAVASDVQKLGETMVNDHSLANEELKALAAKKNVILPADIATKDKRLADRLTKAHGGELDRIYTKAMVDEHKEDVALFERTAKKADDPEIADWAAKTLPTLRHHLHLAEQAEKTLEHPAKAMQ